MELRRRFRFITKTERCIFVTCCIIVIFLYFTMRVSYHQNPQVSRRGRPNEQLASSLVLQERDMKSLPSMDPVLVHVRHVSNVLAYSLYGDDGRYTQGALINAKLFKHIFPGWMMRVYHDNTVPPHILDSLETAGVELHDMSGSDLNPMTWRFLAASNSSVNMFCSRDVDSRLTYREFLAVQEWERSEFPAHVIRDHPSHIYKRCAIPGGMWCAKHGLLADMNLLINSHSRASGYDLDQQFLKAVIWPKIHDKTLQHVSFHCRDHANYRLMIPRVGMEHVGAVYLDGELRESDVKLLREGISQGSECSL